MIIVLLSGGSGKRLWPLSNDSQSKQFLKLLKDDNELYESMVQRVLRQIKKSHPKSKIYISSNQNQLDILNRQLYDIEIIAEPLSADTYPAIILSAVYLHYQKNLPKDEVIIICPIDPYAETMYFDLFEDMQNIILSGKYNIALMGALPTYPSEKYGYIILENGKVKEFREKPDKETAQCLIDKGALWNCGVFALKIGYVLEHAKKYINYDSYESVLKQYSQLPKISFDYEVSEKETSIGYTTYTGKWKDMGTWNTLTEEMNDSRIGKNVLMSETCENTHILNMLDIPVITIGVKNAVIVASHDGILVSDKAESADLKPYAEQIDSRPMYEQMQWGSYRVLKYNRDTELPTLVKYIKVENGESLSIHYHKKHSEFWIIIKGEGIVAIEESEVVISPGSVIKIPVLTKHKLIAHTEVELIEIQIGSDDLEESDIVKISTEL